MSHGILGGRLNPLKDAGAGRSDEEWPPMG
jgi:hypothetical protein